MASHHGDAGTSAAQLLGLLRAGELSAELAFGRIARRFFANLESRDPSVHVGRIAALDACVCQVLSRILAADRGSILPPTLRATLELIRRDEGRHVRTARTLALELGIGTNKLQCLDRETRQAFDRVLCRYEPAFLILHVHAGAMRRQIRRDER